MNRILANCQSDRFLQMVWAIDGIQSSRCDRAAKFIEHTNDFVTTDLTSRYFVHKWSLEDLCNSYFSIRSAKKSPAAVDCLAIGSWVSLINEQHSVQDAEAGVYLRSKNIFDELTRIGHKQFDWQIGFFNVPQFYRAAFLFFGPDSSNFFSERYGIALDRFVLVGFALFSQFATHPFVVLPPDLTQLGVTSEEFDGCLRLIARNVDTAYSDATELHRGFPSSSFRPSILRSRPCIILEQDSKIACPLIDLLLLRITDGIYFDLMADASGNIRTEIGQRFELYVNNLISSYFPEIQIMPEFRYGGRAARRDSPDFLLENDGRLRLLIECKAKKMTIESRYSDWPSDRLPSDAEEIAKGIFQIWRFVADCESGRVPDRGPIEGVLASIVTLESWTNLSQNRRERLFARANALADEHSSQIEERHRVPVSFCEIKDLERLLRDASTESLLSTFEQAATPAFQGWHLSSIHSQQFPEQRAQRDYPFKDNLGEFLPWWNNEQLGSN
ncbi:hypothetical protein [Hyphomonas jannaschiana]|uniref:hypothetical protein n=1 Tax=Hyphomonas jannaschiana TaxID=86 RepID=UPI0035C74A93